MGGNKISNFGRPDVIKKHYCPNHDSEAKPVMQIPGRKMVFRCDKGCYLSKKETVLK